MVLDYNSPVPLYIQIENQIRKEILKPEYKSGKMLPNEVDLSQQLGISRSTLRQAINKLVYDGLLIRKKGVGTVVANTAITSNANNWLSFSQEMKMMGLEVKNYDLHVSWIHPDEDLCNFFHITGETKVMKLERLRGSLDNPFVYFVSYFNPRIGLKETEDFSRMLYDILKEYNVIAKLSKEQVSAMLADRFLADKLGLKQGEPILKRKRFVYDPGGRAVEWNVGYYRADSFVYTVESERKE
ncbi:GntR family transcriptional regulator [Dysgonomonas sp. ZJ709]|uniref:GntR family transcriptional regulator n=1 Tax=unclassified Dysgonomonas TaxID=2630389 RepID=UPI00351A05D4